MLILADFPKPTHGMSNINNALRGEVISADYLPYTINTAPSYAAKYFGSKIWWIIKVVHTFYCFLKLFLVLVVKPRVVVYRPINGGLGQFYDLVYIALCQLFVQKIFIHHHSFNYINKRSHLFSVLNKLAGKKAVHIVLGVKMGKCLSRMYDIKPEQVEVLSNIAFFKEDKVAVKVHHKELVIGHLANLCIDKGIDDFASLCRELKIRNVLFKAKIAGPYADVGSVEVVNKLLLELGEVEYLGPVYGADKETFFQSLDVFVFPSKYKNEAEPLVLYEAAKYGVLNVGTQRGCMQDVIGDLHGSSFPEDENLVLNLANSICEAVDTGALNEMGRKGRVDQFNLMQSQAKESLNNLMTKMAERNRDVSKT